MLLKFKTSGSRRTEKRQRALAPRRPGLSPPGHRQFLAALPGWLFAVAWRSGALAILLPVFGCAPHPRTPPVDHPRTSLPNESNPIVTPSTMSFGKVIGVDTPGHFVVLAFPAGNVPKEGVRFDLYRRGLKAAEVRIAGPQTLENTVADLVTGAAEVGDEARPQ